MEQTPLVSCSSLALAPFAPSGDPAVGVLNATGEVYFKPVPNDGSQSSNGGKDGASAMAFNITAPSAGRYGLTLVDRPGFPEFSNVEGSACRHKDMHSGSTDSFYLCSSDPRSAPSNRDANPDLSSCATYRCCGESRGFTLSAGANTLWLASREVCSLASEVRPRPKPAPP